MHPIPELDHGSAPGSAPGPARQGSLLAASDLDVEFSRDEPCDVVELVRHVLVDVVRGGARPQVKRRQRQPDCERHRETRCNEQSTRQPNTSDLDLVSGLDPGPLTLHGWC